MHGFLNIDKPAGMTSHDVVARVRRLSGQRRVGHAGTLDPAATGVLVVALGGATRLIEYVQDQTLKTYHAVVRLGTVTATDDAEGAVLETQPVPPLDTDTLAGALAQFRGMIEQVPPMYSALHHQGRRLYELARAGKMVERDPRRVFIDRLALIDWQPPDLTIEVRCGKGTYIRALARDLGAALGCGAHLRALRRTAVGTFRIEDAVPLDTLDVSAALLPPYVAVADWPMVTLSAAVAQRVRNGLPIARPELADHQRARAHDADGTLVALLTRDGPHWKPAKVFHWS